MTETEYTSNGTAGREADVKPTGFFFQMPKRERQGLTDKEIMNKTFAERKAEWEDYHRENPMVWEYFQKFSFEAIRTGRKKISHWLIINRIRWEVYIVTTGEEFKISNNFIAFYARLWQQTFPQHKELFNTKRMIGE